MADDDRVDPRITALAAREQAAMREAMPAAVLKGMGGGRGGGGDPPASWEEMVERSAEGARQTQEALEAAGVAETWEELQEGKWQPLIDSLSEGLEVTEHSCAGPDGNTVPLCMIRPEGATGSIPCAYYIHGGGMMMMSMRQGIFQAWGRLIARQGIAAVLVDFRNSLSGHDSVPEVAQYPAGLNDCFAGLEWLSANREELRITDQICVTGDSGGGNLCIAVALKAMRAGRLDLLPSGVFSMCPFIDGNHSPMGYSQAAYDAQDPLAWPSFATPEDLKGMPRTVISVNELDSLKDEGIAFYRVLLAAGVHATCREVLGTQHSSELNHPLAVPDIALATARALADFTAHDGPQPVRMAMPPSPGEGAEHAKL